MSVKRKEKTKSDADKIRTGENRVGSEETELESRKERKGGGVGKGKKEKERGRGMTIVRLYKVNSCLVQYRKKPD